MKVREILEILEVPAEELMQKLENVGINANLDTVLDSRIIKNLSKVYKVDIKPTKKKTTTKPKQQPKKEENKKLDKKEDTKKQDTKKQDTKMQDTKKEENKKQDTKKEETKKQDTKKEETSKSTNNSTRKPKSTNKDTRKPRQPKTTQEKPTQIPDDQLELRRVYDDKYQDFEEEAKVYTRLKNVKKNKAKTTRNRQANVPIEKQKGKKILYYFEGMTVAKIADGLNVNIGEIVKKLIGLGYMVSATQVIEREVIEILALDYGFEVKDEIETDITKFEQMDFVDDPESLVERPPIVTIMGHVDHGKTTLLDSIRNTQVVSSEAGGITQHIGAYQVKKNDGLITFNDTPGHAAFTEMRARGAEITDIVVLVVAADDGVMPQTKEAIEHAQAAKVPIIVAINKMDKPGANPELIKQELANYNLLSEDWGGSTIFVPISALKGQGVEELLDMILLVSEMEEYKANPNRLGMGTVIEAKLDKGRGAVATLLVKNGSIKVGDPIVVGTAYGKIRAMQDETTANIQTALPSKAVEVTGLSEVPNAGDHFMVFEDEKSARLVAEKRANRIHELEINHAKPTSFAHLFDEMEGSIKELKLIIKGDVQGSIEALKTALEKVDVEGAKIEVVRSAVGTVTETDISLAIASESIIIGFNIRPNAKILDYAKEQGVEVRLYNIIYNVIEDIEAAMKGLLDPVYEEKITGQAEVRNTFKASKIGTIAGCYVTNGFIRRGSDIRLVRDSLVVYTGALSSLKRFKDDVKEVKAGFECGLTIENFNDIKVGDVIEGFTMEKVK